MIHCLLLTITFGERGGVSAAIESLNGMYIRVLQERSGPSCGLSMVRDYLCCTYAVSVGSNMVHSACVCMACRWFTWCKLCLSTC
jgi:hypothetical protein